MPAYRVHRNSFVGLVTATFANGARPSYETYEFDLTLAHAFFKLPEDLQLYNRGYRKADELFSHTPAGSALRLAVHVAFATTFSVAKSTRQGHASSGAEFVEILHSGRRHGYDRLFDFSLTVEGVLRISEASMWGPRDIASKHSVLANGSETVLYAGTLMFSGDSVILSNDSGTYAPKAENLPKLVALMEAEFPGLIVTGFEQCDPDYKQLHAQRTYSPLESVAHLPAVLGAH